MSKTSRSPTESVASDFAEGSIFCGIGSPRPKPRLLSGTLFGHVEGAFDEKTLPIGYGCDKKNSPKSSPNGKEEEEKQGKEKCQDEEKKTEEDGSEEIGEEKKTQENEVEEVNEKDEVKEEKSDDTKEEKEEEKDAEVDAEEEKGPMPVSEAVSTDVVF